jgi:phosphohistidine phosphatase
MKSLMLLRHAKAGWGDSNQRDFDRPLTEQGARAADILGEYMRRNNITPDTILCSPAVRTRETLKHVDDKTGWILSPIFVRDIYMATAEHLMQLVQSLHEPNSNVLMIGHNPGFEDLLLELVGHGDASLRDMMVQKLPTATLAQVDFDVDSWKGIAKKSGTLSRFIRPVDLGFTVQDDS